MNINSSDCAEVRFCHDHIRLAYCRRRRYILGALNGHHDNRLGTDAFGRPDHDSAANDLDG